MHNFNSFFQNLIVYLNDMFISLTYFNFNIVIFINTTNKYTNISVYCYFNVFELNKIYCYVISYM